MNMNSEEGDRRGGLISRCLPYPSCCYGQGAHFSSVQAFQTLGLKPSVEGQPGRGSENQGERRKVIVICPHFPHRRAPTSGGVSGGARWGSRPARECGALRTSQTRALLSPGPCWLSLTSFLGISPKRESVFLLETSSPWPSVLPYRTDQGCEWGP